MYCLLAIVFRARARQASIVFLLYMHTVRNNNSCLNFRNFRACARNLSPLNRATAATQRYLQTSFCDLPCKLSFPHSAFYPLFRRPFRIFGFCIFRGVIKTFCNSLWHSVARYHGTTAAPRYHFSTVGLPVPSALRYYLVPRYHNYCGSSAWYFPMLTHSNEHLLDCIVFGLIAIFGLSSVVHC